ncbi:N-acetylglucosamine-6-phosphate deacetylase [Marinilongibacter aquaticus]|uniref:N-acetylglucosamine-6-phosphate deacetylase n=1 Tax=Marinilongibacter aquaticus TaxID=2975157 RepID=UPI0021BD2472|nr:N-acetylglucosamine-6-phosphate deacetylase [Marinilongibacter aquaticus]UBM59906.1 N-acetylglucosamine-6-phosphate deacetylase [Marinilongibacter aquaticus]
MIQLSARRVFTGEKLLENKRVFIDQGKIVQIVDEPLGNAFQYDCLAPAFFDTHINGGEQHYFTQAIDARALDDIETASRHTGTGYVLPALITSSHENILKGLDVLREYKSQRPNSAILGLHLEGPYLNPKKRGAHLLKYVRKPNDREIDEILERGADLIKIWTVAAELFSESQIQKIQKSGIQLSLGHSDATFEEANQAFGLGIRLVTHLYNAMSGLHHRKPGIVGATFLNEEVWAPIIPDGKHVHYGAVKAAFQAKPNRLFIISDALFLGRTKQNFQWEEFDAQLIDGEYVNSEGNLAGSAISVFEGLKNMVSEVNVPLKTAVEMATSRPAEALGLGAAIGYMAPGFPARFSAFDEELKACELIDLT